MPLYQGNRVAYGAGGHWYVQMVVSDDGGNTSSATGVHYTYQVVFENSISDTTNEINWSDPWGSGSANNRSFQGPGTYTIAGPFNAAAGIQYGGGNTLHFRMYATGMAGGGTGPSVVEFDYPLPARSPAPPDPPRTVVVWATTSKSTAIGVSVAGAENGLSADLVNYRIHRQSDGAHMGDKTGPYSGVVYTNLSRVTTYVAYAQVHNGAGWGGFSAGVVFTTAAELPGVPAPGVVSNVKATSASVRWIDPDNGGSAITSRAYQYSLDPAFPGAALINVPSSGLITREDLLPGREYSFRYRVANALGAGPWSPITTIKTQAGGWISIDGVYRLAIPYVNDANGVPRIAVPYVNDVNGIPKPVSG